MQGSRWYCPSVRRCPLSDRAFRIGLAAVDAHEIDGRRKHELIGHHPFDIRIFVGNVVDAFMFQIGIRSPVVMAEIDIDGRLVPLGGSTEHHTSLLFDGKGTDVAGVRCIVYLCDRTDAELTQFITQKCICGIRSSLYVPIRSAFACDLIDKFLSCGEIFRRNRHGVGLKLCDHTVLNGKRKRRNSAYVASVAAVATAAVRRIRRCFAACRKKRTQEHADEQHTKKF